MRNDNSKDIKEIKLATWMVKQRSVYKYGTRKSNNPLSKDKISLLEKIPGWEWEPIETYWNNCIQSVKIFINENDKLPSQSYVSEEGLKLGLWIASMRRSYKKKQLSQDKITRLEKLQHWRWYK